MPNKGYNYDFAMFMEGVQVPFKSANVICTPNGAEASISLHPNEKLFELKPKTAVQVFFREWIPSKDNKTPSWRLMFDGFTSRFDKTDQVVGGRSVAILCRDFRMDIRKFPAAITFDPYEEGKLARLDLNTAGIHRDKVRIFGSGGNNLVSPVDMIRRIAGSAAKARIKIKSGESTIEVFRATYPRDKDVNVVDPRADGCFFLDAFVRGLWLEATSGTAHSKFMNKRIRVDKRFFIPPNSAGYSMFHDQHLGKFAGSAIMGNSKFTSIEATIMRVAGIFQSRVYSCSTPSIISLEDNVNGKSNPALKYIMSEDVRNFLVKNADEFGKPFILNSSMLLPPLEFTAPPNCNIIFPCMYDRIMWQYDQDVDVTRGYFQQFHTFSSQKSKDLQSKSIQVPNSLFSSNPKPTMTIEERYKGVNIMRGSVSRDLATSDASRSLPGIVLKAKAAVKVEEEIRENESIIEETHSAGPSHATLTKGLSSGTLTSSNVDELKDRIAKKKAEVNEKINAKTKKGAGLYVSEVMKRHAVFKFLNTKYAGRVVTVDMAFNPYMMSGFPGVVLADDNSQDYKTQKTLIGMVQQVKHLINAEGEASTSVVMNGVRFYDEATDVDGDGNPYYMKATDPRIAKINKDTLEYKVEEDGGTYFVQDPDVHFEISNKKDDIYDIKDLGTSGVYTYAKDVLTSSKSGVAQGNINTRFVDDHYTPNKISKFYKDVFGQENHFMVGSAVITEDGKDQLINFMYDTIHEALYDLSQTNKMTDYVEALRFVKRNICSEVDFYCSILGLTVREAVNEKNKGLVSNNSDRYIYSVKERADVDTSKHNLEYFGISSKKHKSLLNSELNIAPGDFSSIREGMPLTAFISERKEAVKEYLDQVIKQVQGVTIRNVN